MAYIPKQLRYFFRFGDCCIVFNLLRRYLFGDSLRRVVIGVTVGDSVGIGRADFAVYPMRCLQLVFAYQRLDKGVNIRGFDFTDRLAANKREYIQLKSSDFLLLGDCSNAMSN